MATKQDYSTPKAISASSGFGFGFGGPKDEDLYKCVHCGFCLSACPTYLETGAETESPRGRIALMKAVKEERLLISDTVMSHWDLCLQCRACETACPSGVPYGRLIHAVKADLSQTYPRGAKRNIASLLGYRVVLSSPRILRIIGGLLKAYKQSGLQAMMRKFSLLKVVSPTLDNMERSLPPLSKTFFKERGRYSPVRGKPRYRVTLLAGCVMTLTHAEALRATVEVLRINGVEVSVPQGQGCCGALNFHAGETDTALKMATRNIDSLLSTNPDAIIVASAGCGSTMKEYGELLRDVPGYSQKAATFPEKVKDIHEFLAELPFAPPRGYLNGNVVYQDACHLAHAQKITSAPRQILGSIPGLSLKDMKEPLVCCGSAGAYSLTEQKMSSSLGKRKARNVIASGADVVATGNPGCALQMQRWLQEEGADSIKVKFVVELLKESYDLETARPAK